MVQNGQGNGRLANPTSTDESGRSKFLGEIDYVLDQLVASKEGP